MNIPVPAPRWSPAELERDIALSLDAFRSERFEEPLSLYLDLFEELRDAVEDLFELSGDLLRLHEVAGEVVRRRELLDALRFLGGPFISRDDLMTMAQTTLAPSRLASDEDAARRVIDAALLGLDRARFPWMRPPRREPAEDERHAAMIATVALMANEGVRTLRRNQARQLQESAVEEALVSVGFVKVHARRTITVLEDAPGPGEFCMERMFGEDRADLIVGLWDRRRVALECKASNSAVNSVKRVNREAAGKAENWLRHFGANQVVPAAVIAGVFKRANLEAAQSRGLTLFWAHRLDDLVEWIARSGP